MDGTHGLKAPPWRVGVDVGGTFTDLVVADSGGRTAVFKVPSVPDDPGKGAIAALEKACAALGLSVAAFLGECAFFLHGSTVATNTLLEGKGGRVGLLTTAGFRDSLEARRGLRKDPWDHRTPYPPVLVPRYLRLPVRGRIGADGGEIEPVDLDDVRAAIEVVPRRGGGFGRDLPDQQLRQPGPRARGGGDRAPVRALPLGLGLGRYRADHGRVRARLDHRGQRLCDAAGRRLSLGARRPARRARAQDPAADAAKQWRRGLARPADRAAGEPAAVGPVGRGRRDPAPRPGARRGQSGQHGDRRHQLRRDADERGAGRDHRRALGQRLRSGHPLGRHPHRRRRRRHHRRHRLQPG